MDHAHENKRGHQKFGKRHENPPKHMPSPPTGALTIAQVLADQPKIAQSLTEGEFAFTDKPMGHEYLDDGTENLIINIERMK